MEIEIHPRNMAILECFASETRVRMLELISQAPLNIKELADALHLSSAIITKHVQKLEEAGLLRCQSVPGKRGQQKVCYLQTDKITLRMPAAPSPLEEQRLRIDMPIGQYSDYQIEPTCGLASADGFIGMTDDPRYFADPEHVQAAHLWFGHGWIEYRIPNYLLKTETIRSLDFSLEIGAEAPGYNENWPSDIYFSINGVRLGVWTCPGDFGARRGVFTPSWWNFGTQHGLLKNISVTTDGSYIDGKQLSAVRIDELELTHNRDIFLRIGCVDESKYRGGISLFGRQFGNYDQDITFHIRY